MKPPLIGNIHRYWNNKVLWIKDALEAVGRKINLLMNAMGTNCLKETNNFNILT